MILRDFLYYQYHILCVGTIPTYRVYQLHDSQLVNVKSYYESILNYTPSMKFNTKG